jgi:hypothetical protein
MRIDAVPVWSLPTNLEPVSSGVPAPAPAPTTGAGEPTEPVTVEPQPLPGAPAPTAPVEPQFETAKGMLEKLVNGGFNPVAAVRHQMKHAEALSAAGVTLPELPAEAPHGKAYAKFIEQYRAQTQPPQTEPAAATIDRAA